VAHAATRRDSRRRGFLRQVLESTCDALREAGIPWVIGHFPYWLGLRLGFDAFTNHCSFLLQPEEIEQTLGGGRPEGAEGILATDINPEMPHDLFVVKDVRATGDEEAVAALREAAWTARSNGKLRILFEHPPASPSGSTYPIHESLESRLLDIAMACGARVRVTGSERTEKDQARLGEDSPAVYVDMIKVLDLPVLLEQVVAALGKPNGAGATGAVAFDTEVGQATLQVDTEGFHVRRRIEPDSTPVGFPGQGLAQMLTGYRSAKTVAYVEQKELDDAAADMLERLFPRFWRLSRDTKQVYK
jgi:hypothetical protein